MLRKALLKGKSRKVANIKTMDYIYDWEYVEMKVFDIITTFYSKAQRIGATATFTPTSINIYKKARSLNAVFYRQENKINNIKTIGYLSITTSGKIWKFYLTENYDWILNILNSQPRKVTVNEIEYIMFKTFEEL